MNDDLGIGARGKDVAPAPQLLEVVDLAVEYHANRAVLIPYRLVPGTGIYDAQAAHSEARFRSAVESIVVRTSMNDRGAHVLQLPIENGLSFQAVFTQSDYTGDSAHSSGTLSLSVNQDSAHASAGPPHPIRDGPALTGAQQIEIPNQQRVDRDKGQAPGDQQRESGKIQLRFNGQSNRGRPRGRA